MGQVFPEVLARGATRQLYRLLRISAPLLRPLYRHIGLESRARGDGAHAHRLEQGRDDAAAFKQSEI
jgi:hypothetical protein